jgi:hypothetical protein
VEEEHADVLVLWGSNARVVARRTRVTFSDVAEYRWRYFDVDSDSPEEGGLELGGAHRVEAARRVARQGFDANLRHFHISFDEHGTYDVICRDVLIEYQGDHPAGSGPPEWTTIPPPDKGL